MPENKKPSPAISILTPVFNQEKYIAETIESVLSQEYPNLEYLVLDDGSTDGTLEVIRKYAHQINWQTQTNMGESATVNKGVGMLKGEIVGIVNGDDPLLPGILQAVADKFTAHSDLLVVYPDWKMIDADGNLLEYRKTADYDYAKMVCEHYCIPGPGAFFKRELFLKLHGRDTTFRYVADFDFWLRAGLEGPFARIPQTLACHRWYTGGTSSAARGAAMAEEHIKIMDKLFLQPTFPPELLKHKKEAYSSAFFTAGVCSGDNKKLKKQYYLKALSNNSLKYLFKYQRRLLVILEFFLPFLRRKQP